MTAPILTAVAEQLGERRSSHARSSCQACCRAELDEVAAAFAPAGMTEAERRQDGDWAALLLRRALSR